MTMRGAAQPLFRYIIYNLSEGNNGRRLIRRGDRPPDRRGLRPRRRFKKHREEKMAKRSKEETPGLNRPSARFGSYREPIRVLAVISASIFITETLVMLGLEAFAGISPAWRIALDPLLLVATLSPVLYFFLFRPLIRMVSQVRAAEADKGHEKETAQRYLDIAGVTLVVLNAEAKVTLINKKGCEMLGYDEADILGKDWISSFVPERLRPEVRAVFNSLMSGDFETAGYYENAVLCAGGREKIILWHNTVLKEDGRPTGTLSSGEDITERKLAEKALRQSEARYRLVHDTAFDAIITADANDIIIDVNATAERIFGYQRDEFFGMEVTRLMPEPYRKRHRQALRRFIDTGVTAAQGKILELEGLRKNGETFPIEIALGSFSYAGGINFTGTIRDITERKRAEREKELGRLRLNQAAKMEAIGRFAGGIAHDFNNILTSIDGNAELAAEGLPEDDPIKKRIEGITLSAASASRLVKQLMVFSKGHKAEKTPMDINRAVTEILGMVTRLLGSGVEIKTVLEEHPYSVMADESSIGQVLMNLAANARDAMGTGGTLTIRTENTSVSPAQAASIPGAHPCEAMRLTVSDTGKGMDKDLIEQIFEPFFTTKEEDKGFGFGLSMVYGIIKDHHGWITVESTLGKGTSFSIYLPAMSREEQKGHADQAGYDDGKVFS